MTNRLLQRRQFVSFFQLLDDLFIILQLLIDISFKLYLESNHSRNSPVYLFLYSLFYVGKIMFQWVIFCMQIIDVLHPGRPNVPKVIIPENKCCFAVFLSIYCKPVFFPGSFPDQLVVNTQRDNEERSVLETQEPTDSRLCRTVPFLVLSILHARHHHQRGRGQGCLIASAFAELLLIRYSELLLICTPFLFFQAELKEKLAKLYDVRDPQNIFVFGFRTQVHRSSSHSLVCLVS